MRADIDHGLADLCSDRQCCQVILHSPMRVATLLVRVSHHIHGCVHQFTKYTFISYRQGFAPATTPRLDNATSSRAYTLFIHESACNHLFTDHLLPLRTRVDELRPLSLPLSPSAGCSLACSVHDMTAAYGIPLGVTSPRLKSLAAASRAIGYNGRRGSPRGHRPNDPPPST